ncbi:hypothetical protein Cni_G28169 [Canna indica]|uniref:Uncharacterized protein n=1 Tax=Canna indica TaxID=4628 RepID=A0AAQ3QNK8_9LILI|nr:hypothetical protein Cni_G28169 [Canna indica]
MSQLRIESDSGKHLCQRKEATRSEMPRKLDEDKSKMANTAPWLTVTTERSMHHGQNHPALFSYRKIHLNRIMR